MNDNDRTKDRRTGIVASLWLVLPGLFAIGVPHAGAADPPVPIVGTVVDADRRPAMGVEVFFSPRPVDGGSGTVAARAETDAQGRFRLEVPGAPGDGPEPGTLWAYRPGSLVATRPVSRAERSPDLPLTMVLDHPARAEFVVRGPDGRPVAGARIEPRALHRRGLSVPDGLAERIADQTITDARGRAVLTAFFLEEVSTATISAPGLGRQRFQVGSPSARLEARTIELSPVGRVEGRIVAGESRDPGRARLRALVTGATPNPSWLSLSFVDTDDRGRFAFSEVPQGRLAISGQPLGVSPWSFQSPAGLTVEAGRTTRVEMMPVKGVRLEGVVRERDTDRPVAGVAVGMLGIPAMVGRTDSQGRFQLFSRPGRRGLVMGPVPDGLATPPDGLHIANVPAGVAEFELPPILLGRAWAVRGIVVDDRGRPIPGASVRALCSTDPGPRALEAEERSAMADARGTFRIEPLVAGASVRLSAAATDGRRTTREVVTRVGAEPIRLVLDSSDSVSLAGRVVHASGRRVAGARVHIRAMGRDGAWGAHDELVEIRGAYTIKTREDGWFRTPPILSPELSYMALVEADGYEPARTEWTRGKARTFGALVLRPRSEPAAALFDGSVVDGVGRPVAGAAVWIATDAGRPIRAATDAQGRFRLGSVPPTQSFLFVEAAGFRFAGRAIDPTAGPVSIALTRSDERPGKGMTTRPPARARIEERALSHRLILPYVERILEDGGGTDGSRAWALDILAYSDAARVLAIVGGGEPGAPLRQWACARATWEFGRPEGTAMFEAMPEGIWRARGYLHMSRAIPAAEHQNRIDQVNQALQQVRAIADGNSRIHWLGEVAARHLDLGEIETGTKLLRETLPAARALPKTGAGGSARGAFAAGLARIDPAAAIELIEGIDERPAIDRYRIKVIEGITAIDPARAEALLATIEDPRAIADNLPALCHAMARKDPPRARRLVDRKIGDRPIVGARVFNRPYAIGLIALAMAGADRAAAARFLGEAFDALRPMAVDGRRGSPETRDAATIAAALVPVAERIDPALVPEFLWRAASFRGPSRAGTIDAAKRDATLALLLARYDRGAAMVLLAPLLDRRPNWKDDDTSILVRAVAAVDPERAIALVEAMPDESRPDPRGAPGVKDYARLGLADFLAHPPVERWERVTRLVLELWAADD